MSLQRGVFLLLLLLLPHFACPAMERPLLEIEGTQYEGGGGLIRESLTYAAILSKPVRINNIRADRPGKGGLRAEHTTAVDTIARLCGAEISGNSEASRTLTFVPHSHAPEVPINGVIERTIEGAASIFAIAMLPYALLANLLDPVTREHRGALPAAGVTLHIRAGTLCIKAPSFAWMQKVMLPWLRLIGLPEEHLELEPEHIQGFHTDFVKIPGLITVRVKPLTKALPAFQLSGRGRVAAVKATLHAPAEMLITAERQLQLDLKAYFGDNVETEVDVTPTTQPGQYHLLLVATTENPWAVLGYEQVFPAREGFPEGIDQDVPGLLEHLSRMCIRGLQDELRHGKAVDEHMENVLVPYQVLADGFSTVEGHDRHVEKRHLELQQAEFVYPSDDYYYNASTLHQATSLFIADRVTGVEFGNHGQGFGCHGLGIGANASM